MHVNHHDLDSEKDVMITSPNNTTLRNQTNNNTNPAKPWINGPHRITLDKIRVQQQDLSSPKMHIQIHEENISDRNNYMSLMGHSGALGVGMANEPVRKSNNDDLLLDDEPPS